MISPARLEWAADGTPRSHDYDDVYHSTEGGLAQTRHVFLAGNALPQRWQGRRQFTILETGFGLGLNFLATWQAWRNDPQRCERLHFISTELHPFTRDDLATLHTRWPELAPLAEQLQAAWPPLTAGFHHLLLEGGRVALTLLFGDARDTLEQLNGRADAVYLDGFAPRKNPQLWSPEVLQLLTHHAAPGATLASWCVAGEVRAALRAAGWTLRKRPGYAHKWQMLTGHRAEDSSATAAAISTAPRHAIVIGAGIAGCSMAEALTRRGWRITLLERHAAPAQEASGNPAGLLHPMLARDDNLAARFSRAAYLYSLRLLQRLDSGGLPWQACGILQIAADERDAELQRACCRELPADYVSWLDQAEASARAGLPVAAGGWWFPHGAWVNPPALCQALLRTAGDQVEVRYGSSVATLRHAAGQWQALDAAGHTIAAAPHVILANAQAATAIVPDIALTLRAIRGQLSYLPTSTLAGLETALCGVGYAIRTDEMSLVGASFIEGDTDATLRASEHEDNLRKLSALLPGRPMPEDAATLPGRVSFRAASHDRLPLVGTLPQATFKVQYSLAKLPRQTDLHALLGFGARGLSWAPFAAELLAAQLCAEAIPAEQALLRALDPARHHLRWLRRNTPGLTAGETGPVN
ncbi:MAG TPA: bifunctional tRNA (5-methylaminomethyl-2-thiouridine)(34)-methyltransferase MnmD/FAD-dependent 5-carboxymethylaminomethyl-2-thiouridine(34) oxidoreductase MnmC [Rhodocyclaceae bacterium]